MAPSTKDVLKTIKDQLEENQIVTFKWLSRSLKLPSMTAKQFLKEFVENELDKFIITYVVFGRKENGELLLMLTKEKDDTQFTKQNYTVVDKQIYSIQPSQSKFDSAMIYNIDKSTYEMQQMSLSSINYHTEIIRKTNPTRTVVSTESTNNDTNNTTNVNVMKAVTNGHAGGSKKNDFFKKSSPAIEPSGSKDTNEGKASGGKKEKSKPPVTNGRIASFFTKGSVKKEPVIEEKHIVAPKIDSQLSKSDTSSEKLASKAESPDTKSGTEEKSANSKDVKKTRSPARKTENVSHVSKKVGKSASSKNTKSKPKEKKKKKQFKRIVSPLDSDSEDESNKSDSSMDEPEPELEPEPIPAKEVEVPRVTIVSGKKRKRKEIVKEVMDDKGYLNTIKETVYESCDSEEEVDRSPETNKRSKVDEPRSVPEKKAKIEPIEAKNQKTKQASILNFFKKPQKN